MKNLTELTEYFLQHLKVERNLSRNTIEAYSTDMKKFNSFIALNNFRITNMDSEKITSFILYLKKQNLSASTIVRILSSVRSFYRFLAGHGIIKSGSMPAIESPRIHRTLPEILSKEEISAMIENILPAKDRLRNLALIELIYGAGLRVSEVSGIKMEDMNFEKNYIKIRGKGNKERLAFFNKHSLYATEIFMRERSENAKAVGAPYLFVNNRGGRLSRQSIWKMVKQLSVILHSGKNVFPHTFRHSFATHLLEGGLDLRIVQELLGHKSLATTEIYTHINKSQVKSIYKKFHPRA